MGEASLRTAGLHSAFTYGNLLWRDLKGIKMYPGHMTLGSYSRSIILKTHVDTNLAVEKKQSTFNLILTSECDYFVINVYFVSYK